MSAESAWRSAESELRDETSTRGDRSPLVAYRGPLAKLSTAAQRALFDRTLRLESGLATEVAAIVQAVERQGDAALERLTQRFDGVRSSIFGVAQTDCEAALRRLDGELRRALERAAENLRRVAVAELPAPLEIEVEPGVVVGRRAEALARVGVYAPGGRAAYASSVLMGVVPARVAGVGEIVVCSPPGPTGLPSDVVLAAAVIGGADRVFALGGAQAIAAMALGTEQVPQVCRVVGPGNAWVAEAKRQLAPRVGIDSAAGPSELVAVADDTTDPEIVARELVAQAEHDVEATVVALTLGEKAFERVLDALARAVPRASRRSIVERALERRGAVLEVRSLEEAWGFVRRFAPEHLFVAIEEPERALASVRACGTVFLGSSASVAFGDYMTGANHVLPTAGESRRASGLSVFDFVRWASWQRITPAGAQSMARDVSTIAKAEGLLGHAEAAGAWENVQTDENGAPRPHGPEPRPPVERTKLAAGLANATLGTSGGESLIDLSDNTNLFGVPPSAEALLREDVIKASTRYPSPYAEGLKQALARAFDLDPRGLTTGAGSDDALFCAFRASSSRGGLLAYAPPTFSMIPALARAAGLQPVEVSLDAEAIARTRPSVVYLCSPNNPTGSCLPPQFVDDVLSATQPFGTRVILDEAYVEYAGRPSLVARAARSDRLVVVRTFSKAYGLAGFRIGWASASPDLVRGMDEVRGPYKVGNLAERLAQAAVAHDKPWIDDLVAKTLELRERFRRALEASQRRSLPSEANFVLIPVGDAEACAAATAQRGVAVRALPKLPGVGDALRVTVGPWPLMVACLEALGGGR